MGRSFRSDESKRGHHYILLKSRSLGQRSGTTLKNKDALAYDQKNRISRSATKNVIPLEAQAICDKVEHKFAVKCMNHPSQALDEQTYIYAFCSIRYAIFVVALIKWFIQFKGCLRYKFVALPAVA